jgi:hypothetical protein
LSILYANHSAIDLPLVAFSVHVQVTLDTPPAAVAMAAWTALSDWKVTVAPSSLKCEDKSGLGGSKTYKACISTTNCQTSY